MSSAQTRRTNDDQVMSYTRSGTSDFISKVNTSRDPNDNGMEVIVNKENQSSSESSWALPGQPKSACRTSGVGAQKPNYLNKLIKKINTYDTDAHESNSINGIASTTREQPQLYKTNNSRNQKGFLFSTENSNRTDRRKKRILKNSVVNSHAQGRFFHPNSQERSSNEIFP